MRLRRLSYLAPSLPAELFEALGRYLAEGLGVGVDVDFDTTRSGPRPGGPEPFSAGEVDAAAIDSNVWRRRRREAPVLDRRLCAIAGLGPHPVQPLVARAGLPTSVSDQVRMALLELPDDLSAVMALAELSAFGTITDVDYDGLRHSFPAFGLDRIAR